MSTLEENKKQIKELALENLFFFCCGVLNLKDFVLHVHGYSCEYLQNFPSNELGLVMPRGFFKTSQIMGDSIWRVLPPRFPNDPWHNPNERILIVQNIIDNAEMRVHAILEEFEHNTLLQSLFPEIIPENFNKQRWGNRIADIRRTENHPEGTFNAAGVGTALVSRHFTIINEDDTISPRKDDLTNSEAIPTRDEIAKAVGFHRSVNNLMINHKRDKLRFIGTRWCMGDVIGWIEENQPSFPWFQMSVWADSEKTIPTYPERFDLEVLQKLREAQGSYIFASQYENSPLDDSQLLFKPEHLEHFYEEVPKDGIVFMAVDPAISENSKADFITIVAVMLCPNKDVVILDYIRRRATARDPKDTIDDIFRMNAKWKPVTIWVETIAYQKALKNLLVMEAQDRRIALPTTDFADYRKDSKMVMIKGLQPIAERHNLRLKKYHVELIKELTEYPFSAHDDLANAVAIIARKGYYPQASVDHSNDYDPERELREIKAMLAQPAHRHPQHGEMLIKMSRLDRRKIRELIGGRW